MRFRFEGIPVVTLDSTGSYAILTSTNVVFLGFDNLEHDLHALIFFVGKIVKTDQTRMNSNTDTITIRCIGFRTINVTFQDLRVCFFNVLCRNHNFDLRYKKEGTD